MHEEETECQYITSEYRFKSGKNIITAVWENDYLILKHGSEVVQFDCETLNRALEIIVDGLRFGHSKTQIVNRIQKELRIRRQRAFWLFNAFLNDNFVSRGGIPILEVHIPPFLGRDSKRRYACMEEGEIYFLQCLCPEVLTAIREYKPPQDVVLLNVITGDYFEMEFDVEVAVDLLKDSNASSIWELCTNPRECLDNYFEEVRESVHRGEGC